MDNDKLGSFIILLLVIIVFAAGCPDRRVSTGKWNFAVEACMANGGVKYVAGGFWAEGNIHCKNGVIIDPNGAVKD